MADISIESHEDDSVTLRVGTLTAHIKGASWREAVDAAHTLGGIISGRVEARKLATRLRGITDCLEDIDQAIRAADHHVRALVDYARPNESEGTG